jgi:hypothetical protein
MMAKLGRKKQFLTDHPYCCFCGGTKPSVEIDHVPPKACFPKDFFPEGFESPACSSCNRGSKKDDQICGFYTHVLNFNQPDWTPHDTERLLQLRDAIARNYPDALPDLSTAVPIHRVGSIITPRPIAVSVQTNIQFRQSLPTLQRKLTHALYYRDTGKSLTTAHAFQSGVYQIQGNPNILSEYFSKLLPNHTVGSRINIKNYGERFLYKSGYKEDEDFFVYAAQFGKGLIIFGITLSPSMTPKVQYNDALPLQFAGRRETRLYTRTPVEPT